MRKNLVICLFCFLASFTFGEEIRIHNPNSKIIFTEDLGLFHGLSGAGVLTDTDELIAITSATAGKGNKIRFSVFPVFDEKVESFLVQNGLSLYFKHVNLSDFKDVTQNKEILISLDNNK